MKHGFEGNMAVYGLGCSVQARMSLFNYINKLFYYPTIVNYQRSEIKTI